MSFPPFVRFASSRRSWTRRGARMDSVRIKDLRVQTRIGVTEEERATPQAVLVSVDVLRDLDDASTSDNLDQTLDYGTLVPEMAKLIERSECKLLEKLAGDIASFVESFGGVTGVTVEIAKESPPLDEEVRR